MRKRYNRLFVITIVLLLTCFLIDLACGAVLINPFAVFNLSPDSLTYRIFIHLHLPRTITALIAGGTLSVCGTVLQTFFRNPLADPHILGISSGACLGVALFTLISTTSTSICVLSSLSMAIAAIVGSSIALSALLLLSFYISSTTTLLLIGVLLGTLINATTAIMQLFIHPEALKTFIIWSMGTLHNTTWNDILILSTMTSIGILLLSTKIKSLNAMLLGEDYATTLGISLNRFRWQIIAIIGILTGTVTAFCGPISFIGMAIPHLTRRILNTNNHSLTIPLSTCMGACILLICDMLTSLSGLAIPISIVTSLIGGPIIVYILVNSSNKHF